MYVEPASKSLVQSKQASFCAVALMCRRVHFGDRRTVQHHHPQRNKTDGPSNIFLLLKLFNDHKFLM